MKKTLEAWSWSLAQVARSPATLMGLALLAALWAMAAYEWLALPESSIWMILLSFVWALAQILIAVSALAGTAASAAESAAFGTLPRAGLAFITLNRRLLSLTALIAVPAFLLIFLISQGFSWLNAHSLEVASFLTFHSESPVSYKVVDWILWAVEASLWIVVIEFLLTFLIVLVRAGWLEAGRASGRAFRWGLGRGAFLTGLVAFVILGGVSYFLINWVPQVTPGFRDYTQAAVRLGGSLFLMSGGWLFNLLALARLNPRRDSSPLS